MNQYLYGVKLKFVWSVFLYVLYCQDVTAWREEYFVENGNSLSGLPAKIDLLSHQRSRRAVDEAPKTSPAPTTGANSTAANVTVNTTLMPTAVTQIPLLGVNGSGQLKVNTENLPKVSDPIVPDDNLTAIFDAPPEKVKAEHNLTSLTIDHHTFYNSTFVGNVSYFNEYWKNISNPGAQVHGVLSNSHRRAITLSLSFPFPFYGNPIYNITVATGGFIYTGEHVHNWLAATQYIAPLMANFDTSLTNESHVLLFDDGEKFTAFWENVTLQENVNQTFTFAVTLYKNGDIVFAYKDIPMDIQDINDAQHPVKVGISDAYLNDNIMFYVRRKTIYEYHRVSFKNRAISNSTILKLIALPTCIQYDSCDTCLNHQTGFNCTWCPAIQKCSSGTDRNKQDWKLRNCDKTAISEAGACSAAPKDVTTDANNKTIYSTDSKAAPDANVDIVPETVSPSASPSAAPGQVPLAAPEPRRSAVGGVVGAMLAVALLAGLVWVLYAFKNPHTRSGQLLIKYRPSQWSWKRGEARYTAATIHM